MKSVSVTIQMKATEQFFPVVLFIMLYKVVPTFESVCKILNSHHSNESYQIIISYGAIQYAIQVSNFFCVIKCNRCRISFCFQMISTPEPEVKYC